MKVRRETVAREDGNASTVESDCAVMDTNVALPAVHDVSCVFEVVVPSILRDFFEPIFTLIVGAASVMCRCQQRELHLQWNLKTVRDCGMHTRRWWS